LKWHGGKNYLARQIVDRMPPHLNYVEPYAGGLAVLFARDPDDERLWWPGHKGVSEVVNDLNRDLTNFWRVLQDADLFEKFRRRVEATPFSGHDYIAAEVMAEVPPKDEWLRAWGFFVRNRQSLAGRMSGFTGITKTRTRARMNNEVSAWLSAVDGLPVVHARLRRVLVLPPQTALRVIDKFDVPETFFYLDPPYLHETRVTTGEYAHEMTEADHRALLERLCPLKGKFILSGYWSTLYGEYEGLMGWERHEIKVPNQASGAKKKEKKTECLWMNF
jgi:DNA adenine methylase